MGDLSWLELFSTGILTYGAPVLGLALCLGALGLPFPSTLLVLTAGAFAQQGVLDGGQAMAMGLAGVVLGDSLGYGLGRFAGTSLPGRFRDTSTWRKAQAAFAKRGNWMIYLTRFLLTPLAMPVNLIAGSSGYGFWSFLGADALGELTWLALYGGVGYALGSQWASLGQLVAQSNLHWGTAALAVIGLLLLAGAALSLTTTSQRNATVGLGSA
jgi:membrane protein DedA with SNARE-associated domain